MDEDAATWGFLSTLVFIMAGDENKAVDYRAQADAEQAFRNCGDDALAAARWLKANLGDDVVTCSGIPLKPRRDTGEAGRHVVPAIEWPFRRLEIDESGPIAFLYRYAGWRAYNRPPLIYHSLRFSRAELVASRLSASTALTNIQSLSDRAKRWAAEIDDKAKCRGDLRAVAEEIARREGEESATVEREARRYRKRGTPLAKAGSRPSGI